MLKKSYKFTGFLMILILLTSFSPTPAFADSCPTLGSAGKVSTAASFDGTSYIKLAYNASNPIFQINAAKSFSIVAWIKPSASLDGYRGIIGDDYGNNWLLSGGDNSNSIGFYVQGTRTSTAANSISLNTWTHVVATFNGTTKSIYINGVLVVQDTVSSINMSGNGDILVGSNIYGDPYKGLMDEVRIYSKALSPAEVSSLYTGTNVSSSLSGYWALNDVVGSTSIADSSGNNASSSCAPVLGSICQYTTNNAYGSWYLTGPDGSIFSITDTNSNCCMDVPGTWTIWGVQTINGFGTPTVSPSSSQTLTGGGSITWTIDYPIGSSGPAVPTVTGSTSGYTNISYTYNLLATDPSGKQIRYGVDWSDPFDGVADEWFPAVVAASSLTTTWSKVSGPGTVTFGNSAATTTTATFGSSGTYNIRLSATNGTISATDDVAVVVNPASIAYWNLNESAGATSFADSSGNSTTATCNNGCPTAGATGNTGNAVGFGGSSNTLQIAYNVSKPIFQINGSEPFSVAVWIKPNSSIDGWRGIIGGDYTNNWLVSGGDNSNSLGFYIQGTRLSTPANSIPLNTWTHVSVVFDGTNKYIYLNGVLSVQANASGATMSNSSSPLYIGANPYGAYFDGTIDELKVYDVALSATEVSNIVTASAGSSGSGTTNQTITVNAGADQVITLPSTSSLAGTATDSAQSGVTYVNSGVSQDASHSWSTIGTKQFQVLSQNTDGTNSAWSSPYSVSISNTSSTATIGASPTTVSSGGSSTITWSSTNATTCTVNPGGWTGTASSHSTGALAVTTTYTISCSNGAVGGNSSNSTTVTVGSGSYSVNVTKVTGGTVRSVGDSSIDCGTTCYSTYANNSTVTLKAYPSPYFKFGGWTTDSNGHGDCTGTGQCVLNVTGVKYAVPSFIKRDTINYVEK